MVKALGYIILFLYKVLKLSCDTLMAVALLAEKQMRMDEIEMLHEKVDLVEARDRFLFSEAHAPNPENTIQKMKDWIECVQMSIERTRNKNVTETVTKS